MKQLTASAIAVAFALGGFGAVANAASDVEKKMDPLPGNVDVEGHGQNPQFNLQDDKKATPESMMNQGQSGVETRTAPLPGNVDVEGHGQNPQFKTEGTPSTTSGSEASKKMDPLPGNVDVEGHGQNPQFKVEDGSGRNKQ
ncbi:MAG: hypothetical protein IPM60_12045 [Rhodospirillales bacterium]|nr:hypothetical protein [Rhodospirillales bacterium]